jgi:DNA-binding transcriptional MerR regulator
MDHDEIIQKRVRRIARDHGCSVAEVNAALDHHPIELNRDTFLKRTLAMELVELDELQQAFRDKALEDRDVAAGVLLIKVAERRATLLGLNAPIGHAVQVIQHEPENKPTSTERLRAAIDRIRGKRHQDDLPATDQDDPPSTH